jgi:hypothetical protein
VRPAAGKVWLNSVGNGYSNVQDEAMIGFFKAEVIHRLVRRKSVEVDECDTFK